MTSGDNSPHEVGQDISVLVLATAVITVQVNLLLPQPIVLKVVVEMTALDPLLLQWLSSMR